MASPNHQITDNLVQKLSSSSISSVKKTLAIVAKLTKRSNEADLFREKGGLDKLIALLKRPNNTIIDMAMSAIANCAMFEENKKRIRQLDGIQPIVLVLKNLKSFSIRNRAARALANLAENDQNAMVIEELGAIEELVKLLHETTDCDCQQTVLRGLKILSTTQSRRKIIYEQGGVKSLVELLKSDKLIVVSCCVKTICELTKSCSKEIAQQVQEFEGIKEIIKLTNSEKTSVSSAAFMTVVNLCVHAPVRVSIGSEGGITVLYKQAELNLSSHMTLKALEGLCFCCREAVNRNKVYECGGVELLLKQLSSSEHPSLHRKIITAFNCFYYHEKCLHLLLSNGIVAALLTYLKKVISSCYNAVSHSEDDVDQYDHESFTSDFSSPTESPRSIHLTTIDGSTDISCHEAFLEEAENLAIKVRDAKESSRVLTFKRKPRAQSLSSSTPTVKAIDQSPSLFSFSSLQSKTETTSMMNTCTLSSTSVTSTPTVLQSFPQGLICSTPTAKDNPSTDVPIDVSPLADICSTSESCTLESATSSPTKATHHGWNSCADSSKTLDISSSVIQDVKEFPTTNMKHPVEDDHLLRSVDSALLLTPPKNEKSHVTHYTLHGPGHNAILLLSRFSHMSDQSGLPHLLTRQCISVLLNYLCLVEHPSPKCVRLLNSLTSDPQCFEILVGMGIACDIHMQLCCGYIKSCAYVNQHELHDTENTIDKEWKINSDSNMKDQEMQQLPETSHIHIPHDSIIRCKNIGVKLMENLTCQSQTPFGKGVLIHLLTKGCGEDWLGCVLTLPLICRSENLRNKVMIKNGGLKMLCDLLISDHDDQVFAKVVSSLKYLSLSTALTLQASTKSSSMGNYLQNQIQAGKRKLESESSSDEIRTKCIKLELPSPSNSDYDIVRNEDSSSCKYYSKHHGPCEIKLQVDSGEQIPVHPRILCSISEMFAAMLSSNYKEGSLPVIPIQQVSLNVLKCVIHYGYGCTLPHSFDQEGTSENNEVCRHLQMIFTSCELETRFQFMVNLLAIADRFLMAKLRSLTEELLKGLANEMNIVSLTLSAAHYHSKCLCEFGLRFLLLKVSDPEHQIHALREIFQSGDKCKLLNILYEVLSHHLQNQQ